MSHWKGWLAHLLLGAAIGFGVAQGIPDTPWTYSVLVAAFVGTIWEYQLQGLLAKYLFPAWDPEPSHVGFYLFPVGAALTALI